MDISDHTRMVFDRIQKFEPECARKIIGYLLLKENGEQEISALASCPDRLVRDVALVAKMELQKLSANSSLPPVLPPSNSSRQGLSQLPIIASRSPTSPASFPVQSADWEQQPNTNITNTDFTVPMNYIDSTSELQKRMQLFGLENNIDPMHAGNNGIANDYFRLDASPRNLNAQDGRRLSSELPVKPCHYFNRGFCKNGSSCRFYHAGQVGPERLSLTLGNDANNDDPLISPGSLAQLESELVELLKLRRNNPITIASLPIVYFDKYQKALQADGYLSESQRHGKSGYNLSKLLARLKNTIRVIERPHGQHVVVLAEDVAKYGERRDPGQNISAARQIYLTFPADCTFTEEDVSNYFKTFGAVEDVRLPCLQERMFGFVTFADPKTVKTVLERGNPHFVVGSRVLVKPYREKLKNINQKCTDRIKNSVSYQPQYADIHSELTSMSRSFRSISGDPTFLRRRFIEEEERSLELQMRQRLAELQRSQHSAYLGFSMNGLNARKDTFNFQPTEYLNHTETDRPRDIKTESNNTGDYRDGELDLPESPFAFLRDD
ncbi:hypothetical protein QN277_018451 [Acacia crassicarpa]|uniref:Zinc finger CCCH domain-containing protein 18-like n=1 Tax=Acacia crassicarpa TaxID=499986 RepID=A0AAE1JR67_9FABA|nr:hypothetical protein QN277_018451 [Acacia crassicarpa]